MTIGVEAMLSAMKREEVSATKTEQGIFMKRSKFDRALETAIALAKNPQLIADLTELRDSLKIREPVPAPIKATSAPRDDEEVIFFTQQEIADLSGNPAALRFLADMHEGDMRASQGEHSVYHAKRREGLLKAAAIAEAEWA